MTRERKMEGEERSSHSFRTCTIVNDPWGWIHYTCMYSKHHYYNEILAVRCEKPELTASFRQAVCGHTNRHWWHIITLLRSSELFNLTNLSVHCVRFHAAAGIGEAARRAFVAQRFVGQTRRQADGCRQYCFCVRRVLHGIKLVALTQSAEGERESPCYFLNLPMENSISICEAGRKKKTNAF